MIERRQLPRIVERGVAATLSLDVYSDAGTQQTPASGTVTVTVGSAVIVDAAVITPAAPSTYALLAAATADQSLSDEYLEVWTVVISGTTYTFQVEGYLVRRAYHAAITDTDLTDRHTELASFLTDLDITTYQKYRDEANVELQTDLLAKGRRPWLIFDRAVTRRLHVFKSLALIAADFESAIGNGKYARMMKRYEDRYTALLASDNFRYDRNESGTIDSGAREATAGPVMVTAGPRGGWRSR